MSSGVWPRGWVSLCRRCYTSCVRPGSLTDMAPEKKPGPKRNSNHRFSGANGYTSGVQRGVFCLGQFFEEMVLRQSHVVFVQHLLRENGRDNFLKR